MDALSAKRHRPAKLQQPLGADTGLRAGDNAIPKCGQTKRNYFRVPVNMATNPVTLRKENTEVAADPVTRCAGRLRNGFTDLSERVQTNKTTRKRFIPVQGIVYLLHKAMRSLSFLSFSPEDRSIGVYLNTRSFVVYSFRSEGVSIIQVLKTSDLCVADLRSIPVSKPHLFCFLIKYIRLLSNCS